MAYFSADVEEEIRSTVDENSFWNNYICTQYFYFFLVPCIKDMIASYYLYFWITLAISKIGGTKRDIEPENT